jgi:hypothetical protein
MESGAPPPQVTPPVPPQRGVRRYLKYIIGVLVAFGVLGAVGSRIVDEVFSTAGEQIHPEKTVLIGVREDPQGGSDGFALAARSTARADLDRQLAGVTDCDALMTRSKQVGAVDVHHVIEGLVIEGGTRRDVSIVDMHAKVIRREPGLSGSSISCQSAGDMQAIGVGFNLDEEHPVARKLTGDFYRFAGPYFQGNIVRLVKGEVQPFAAVGASSHDYVEWEIEADVIVDGKSRTVTINDHGKPFRVTGPVRKGGRYKRYYEWQWYTQPPRLWIGAHSGATAPPPSSTTTQQTTTQQTPAREVDSTAMADALRRYQTAYSNEDINALRSLLASSLVRTNGAERENLAQALATYQAQFSVLTNPHYTLSRISFIPGAGVGTATSVYTISSSAGTTDGRISFHFVLRGNHLLIDRLAIRPSS